METLSNMDIALFALYQLDGINKKVHTEEIALKCFQLVKERFSWRLPQFRDYPDKTPVRHALEKAQNPENLVIGQAGGEKKGEREGWRLTSEGVRWLKANEKRIAKSLKQELPAMNPRERGRFLKRIRQEEAFSNYLRDGNFNNVSRYNFSDLLRCPPDASFQVIRKKFEVLQAQAELISDDKVNEFLALCMKNFADILNP